MTLSPVGTMESSTMEMTFGKPHRPSGTQLAWINPPSTSCWAIVQRPSGALLSGEINRSRSGGLVLASEFLGLIQIKLRLLFLAKRGVGVSQQKVSEWLKFRTRI